MSPRINQSKRLQGYYEEQTINLVKGMPAPSKDRGNMGYQPNVPSSTKVVSPDGGTMFLPFKGDVRPEEGSRNE
eukprot:2669145-Pyramimonas_sp.AAC.1